MITKRKSVGIGKILNNWVNNYCCYEFFRFCDKSFSYGFSSKKGVKKYDRDVLKNEFLISSSQTAFTVSYLYMTTLLIFHSNSSFQGLADIYNSFHSFNKHDRYREDLNRKRLCIIGRFFSRQLVDKFGCNCTRCWITSRVELCDWVIVRDQNEDDRYNN